MDTTTAASMGLFGLIMSFMFIFAGWYVLTLIARWKVFDKAGLAGWKSLIPIYSDYCTYKISWKTTYFWILLAAAFLSGMISNRVSGYADNGEAVPMMLSLLSTVVSLAVTVINFMMNLKLSQRFGHGVLFGIGLFFFSPVFTLILGLGDSRYLGNPEEGLPPQTWRR